MARSFSTDNRSQAGREDTKTIQVIMYEISRFVSRDGGFIKEKVNSSSLIHNRLGPSTIHLYRYNLLWKKGNSIRTSCSAGYQNWLVGVEST